MRLSSNKMKRLKIIPFLKKVTNQKIKSLMYVVIINEWSYTVQAQQNIKITNMKQVKQFCYMI